MTWVRRIRPVKRLPSRPDTARAFRVDDHPMLLASELCFVVGRRAFWVGGSDISEPAKVVANVANVDAYIVHLKQLAAVGSQNVNVKACSYLQ